MHATIKHNVDEQGIKTVVLPASGSSPYRSPAQHHCEHFSDVFDFNIVVVDGAHENQRQ
jgi:hypothetical protein